MKHFIRKLFPVLMLLALCLILAPCKVSASTKVTKVKKYETYDNNKEKVTIKGLSSSGKTVWKYKCTTTAIAQCSHVSMTSNAKYVYIFDGTTYIRLGKQSGKVFTKKKNMCVGSYAVMYADDDGNCYVINYFGSKLYKFSKAGTLRWTADFGSQYYWACKLKKSGSNIKVYFEEGATKTVNMKTGKIVK